MQILATKSVCKILINTFVSFFKSALFEGAQFLENFVTKFHEVQQSNPDIENKQLDNLTHVLAQMYNFKVCYL